MVDKERHAVAGEYATWAAKQATAAFRWTIAALVIGLGTVGLLMYTIGLASADESVQFTFYKISISVIGLIVAGYAARQASDTDQERLAKKLALDLAALCR